MVKTDERIVKNLIDKMKFDVRQKRNQIKHDKKMAGRLSGYKFKLRPINGKDTTTIEKELTFRKLEKEIERQEKDLKALQKR